MKTAHSTLSRQGKRRGMRRRALHALALFLCTVGPAAALPSGPQVVSGTAAIATTGSTMTVTNSANAIINWNSFSINSGEVTRFVQPAATSAVLNRVVGADPSYIFGSLQSNGTVFLVNQNGILFGPTAKIDVNGLVASSLALSNEDFLAGRLKFTLGPVAGPVENQGEISTPGGGSVYLIAPNVTNSGIITAPNGDILLAAGKEVLLVDKETPEIAMVVSAPEHQALNIGQLVAAGGRIGMYGGIVRQSGLISADSAVRDASGRIFLKASKEVTVTAGSLTTANGPTGGTIVAQASDGTTLVAGRIEAQGTEGGGGTVQLLGQNVGLIDQGSVDVSATVSDGGTVLLGGDYKGANPLVQNALFSYLGPNATIAADARVNGNGGKVVLWSDRGTRVYGTISVQGGSQGGNGGFVETSSRQFLDLQKAPMTGAASGKGGLWLLDPEDITIGIGTTQNLPTAPTDGIFSPFAANTTTFLDVSVLKSYLENPLNGSATVTTASSGSGTGIITLVSDLNLLLTGTKTLNLDASDSILLQANLLATGGVLNLNLNASTGSITLAPDVTGTVYIQLNGGILSAHAQTGINVGGAFGANLTAGSIFFDNQLSGNITVSGSSVMQTTSGPLSLINESNNGYLMLFGQMDAGASGFYGRAAGIELNAPTIKGALIRMEATNAAQGILFSGGTIGDTTTTREVEFSSDLLAVSTGPTTVQTSNASIQYGVNYAPYSGMDIDLVNYLPASQIASTYTPTLLIGHELDSGATATGNILVGGLTWSNGQRLGLLSGGSVVGGNIEVQKLGVIAGGQINLTGNMVDSIALESSGGSITFENAKGFSVVTEVGGLLEPHIVSGVSSRGGDISLSTSAGDIWLAAPVNAATGAVSVTAYAGGIYTAMPGAVNIYGSSFEAQVGTNIGGPQYAVITQTPYWSSLYSAGSIYLDNIGALTTTGPVDAGGMVSLSTHSPLTIGTGGVYAVGDIRLLAAPMGGLDDLTINGPVISSNGNVYLAAGNAIYENALVSALGSIVRTPYLNAGLLPPSLQPAPPPPPLYSDPASPTGTATLEETTSDLLQTADRSPELLAAEDDAAENGAQDKQKKTAEDGAQKGDKPDAKSKKKNYCN